MTENADDPWTTEDLEHVRSEAERFNAQVCDLRRAYLALLETARGTGVGVTPRCSRSPWVDDCWISTLWCNRPPR